MSVLRELPRDQAISGLKIKRRLGAKIHIIHRGETLTLQVIRFESGFQVVLAFDDPTHAFNIVRDEIFDGSPA